MSSANENASPKFRNLCYKHKQSPKELKDKMRKNYKDKVQNCREMLLDRFRGPEVEQYLSNTLTDIYKTMFNFTDTIENDEIELMEELKNELIQEELEWWLREYERSQMENIDWSALEKNDSVICPICQISNFKTGNNNIACDSCKIIIKTEKSLNDVKKSINSCVEKHNSVCSHDPQFTVIREASDTHIYLICDACTEMNIVM